MSRWADRLPRVSVPQRSLPKPITLIVPYYENATFFASQLDRWAALDDDLLDAVRIIIVDDGSPMTPASEVLARRGTRPCIRYRVFRIGVDVPWNWLAARNIAAHHAADGWLLLTDMDHVIPTQTFRSVCYGSHDPTVIYGFSRLEHTGERIDPHPNSWLMTKSMYWKVGGYDEEISGHYGSDGDWRKRCAATAPMKILNAPLIRHEHQDDSSTTRYQRKLPTDTAAVQRIVASRGQGWRPKTLSFPYAEVSL